MDEARRRHGNAVLETSRGREGQDSIALEVRDASTQGGVRDQALGELTARHVHRLVERHVGRALLLPLILQESARRLKVDRVYSLKQGVCERRILFKAGPNLGGLAK